MPSALEVHRNAKARRGPRTPQSIDAHVGRRLRFRRVMEDRTQSELAGEVGLTFQQIQKYEKGLNRISAGHLYQFARALNCSTSFFYDEFEPMGAARAPGRRNELEAFMHSPDAVIVCKTFLAIENADARAAVLGFMRSLADVLEPR